jgi:hypothetical protein
MAKIPDDLLKAAKKYSDKKTVLAFLSFIIVLAITILSSIPEFVIKPEQILTTKFLTKLLMTLIIGVTALVCFILIGGTSNGMNPVSEIYKAREAFRTSAKDIIDHYYSAFKQWIERVRRPAKQIEVNKRVLRHIGITNLNYLDLDECDLRDLVKAPNKELGDKYGVRQITEDQFKVIMAIKEGKTSLKFLNVDDYLLEKTIGVDLTDEELLVNQFKKRNWIFSEKVGSRILILVVVAVTFGCIGWSTIQTIGEDTSVAQRTFTIIWDILTKLATAISSAFIGFIDGGKFNDFDASYLQIKSNIHVQFREDKEFKPLTEQELAKEEYIQYHQKQEQDERKRLGLDSHLVSMK